MEFYDIISVRESVTQQKSFETARKGLLTDHLDTVLMTFIFPMKSIL